MVAWGHQRDRFQLVTKIKSLYMRGRDANKGPRTARSLIPFHDEFTEILEIAHALAPCGMVVYCLMDGPL